MADRYAAFDWNNAKAFLATAETGSLSAAARLLGISQPTLSRQVSALEQQLGMALFERSSTGLKPTPAAITMMEQVQQMAEAAHRLTLAAAGHSESLNGKVSISATEMTALMILPPLLKELRERYPSLTLELIATNEASDLRRREADIAVRSFRPDDHELVIRRLPNERYALFAARSYLASKRATPESELAPHLMEFIGFDHQAMLIQRIEDQGVRLNPEQFKVLANHSLVNWTLVKQGMGVGVMLEQVGLQEPDVEPVLPQVRLPEAERWLVAHRELRSSQRIRVVYDFLAERLAQF